MIANKRKWHTAEAISSLFIVGLGQIIKGESQKGLYFLLYFYFVVPAIIGVSLLFNSPLILYSLAAAVVSAIIVWIYSIGDALVK